MLIFVKLLKNMAINWNCKGKSLRITLSLLLMEMLIIVEMHH